MLDITDGRRQGALEIIDNSPGNIFRHQTGVIPGNGNDRDFDRWEYISRRLRDGPDSEDQNQNRHDDESIGSLQSDNNDLVHCFTCRQAALVMVS